MDATVAHPDPRDVLSEHGLRVTRPRLAVLSTVAHRPHATVDEIAAGVRDEITTVSTQAIYDILGTLTDRGILRRMEPAASAARYELSPTDDHQHLVCRECGRIIDILLAPPPLHESHGYLIHGTEVTIWGTCPPCQQGTPLKETS